jgi:hypothetical protein
MRAPSLNIVAAAGLGIGGALGVAGIFVGNAELRDTLWTINGLATAVAAALLAIKSSRQGDRFIAGGFLSFAILESLLLASHAAGLQASLPTYAGGIVFWLATLIMAGAPKTFGNPTRAAVLAAAVMIALSAVQDLWALHCIAGSRLSVPSHFRGADGCRRNRTGERTLIVPPAPTPPPRGPG